MREHVHSASRRRDERLARVRKLSLWITGGAAAASLGLGTAFAHALPGHSASSQAGTSAGGLSAAGGAPAGGSSNGATASGARSGSTRRSSGHHHRHKLAQPTQQPVNTPAPPVVSSGGS